jgi:hypothetical protein
MEERVFTVQQIGAKESSDRKRADDIYEFIIVPAVKEVGLEPYRADLDLTPGAITPKMLSELLNARVIIADLTGRNPNVFYELGIIHSFARPLISIADSAASLPFDAKDERIIELGDYPPGGLSMRQGQRAIASLSESLKIVLAENYTPRSPLHEVAANRSLDQLAPENPLAAEMAQIRKTLEDIWQRMTLERNSQEQYAQAISSLTQDRDMLERRIDDLRAFEREYRRRLEAYLEAQLRDLQHIQESPDNLSEAEDLERRIDDLRAFEREYRRRLEAYLQGQLTDLRGVDTPTI